MIEIATGDRFIIHRVTYEVTEFRPGLILGKAGLGGGMMQVVLGRVVDGEPAFGPTFGYPDDCRVLCADSVAAALEEYRASEERRVMPDGYFQADR